MNTIDKELNVDKNEVIPTIIVNSSLAFPFWNVSRCGGGGAEGIHLGLIFFNWKVRIEVLGYVRPLKKFLKINKRKIVKYLNKYNSIIY